LANDIQFVKFVKVFLATILYYTISAFKVIGTTLTDPFNNGHPLNGMKFTTKDRDNDNGMVIGEGNNNGGWWHNSCTHIHPTVM